jgi:hypothetical protein
MDRQTDRAYKSTATMFRCESAKTARKQMTRICTTLKKMKIKEKDEWE